MRPLHDIFGMQRAHTIYAETTPIVDVRQKVYREDCVLLDSSDALNAFDRLTPPDEQQTTKATDAAWVLDGAPNRAGREARYVIRTMGT